ncbi:phosphomannomutase/phosphoglucomutase [Candidatus Micrarchaeota archaeon]|nr:phosphomannomutase/phosphoglucomutase [Candidatus Micrarchaeota archaeon]
MPVVRLNPDMFRAYDIRGIVGEDLNDAVFERLGQAFGQYLRERSGNKPSCAVGGDNRESSASYLSAFTTGLLSVGCDVMHVGEITTPGLYFANSFLKTTGAAAVTASHNPPKYNGVKFIFQGKSAGGAEVQRVRELAEKNSFSKGQATLSKKDVTPAYLEALSENAEPLKLKVVADCGNGVASDFAVSYLKSLGCDVVPLHCDSSKPFSVHVPDPVDPDNYVDLAAAVRKHEADVGLLFDGDGDRVGAVDEFGGIVSPDKMLILFARKFLKENPGEKVVIEIKCSQAVQDEVEKLGGTAVWAPTGRTVIEDVLFKEHAKLAGEMSGHFFFLNGRAWLSESLYAARQLLEIIAENGSLSKQVASMPKYVSSREYRVDVTDGEKFRIVSKLSSQFKKTHRVLELDGAKVLFDDGWGLVRASNSEAKVSLRFESKTRKGLAAIESAFKEKLLAAGVSVPF